MTSSPDLRRPAHEVPVPGPRSRASVREPDGDGPYGHLVPLLLEFVTAEGSRRRALRASLVAGFLPVVKHIARRYRGRGETVEDLEQVGSLGLLTALERFDPARGTNFTSYLVPTVTGEVRRHFRDRAWSVRVPRQLKDLQHPVRHAVEELSTRLHRAPRPSEIATHLGIAVDEVIDALQARNAYAADSLDGMAGSTERPLAALLGRVDGELDTLEHRDALRAALADLPERERMIILLRFFGELTQTQIAQEIGVSQMHVSRLLSRTLTDLRSVLDHD